VLFRKELDQRRDDCRRLALKVLEARLGIPAPEIAKILRDDPDRNAAPSAGGGDSEQTKEL
jgi:hypothetical protein